MKYMVHINDGIVEVPFEEPFGSTAIGIAEILANKTDSTVTVEVIPEKKKDYPSFSFISFCVIYLYFIIESNTCCCLFFARSGCSVSE